jgi:hypothetical protein
MTDLTVASVRYPWEKKAGIDVGLAKLEPGPPRFAE